MNTRSSANENAATFNRQVGWSIMQRADDPDVKRANQQLKQDIANGARGVALVFEGAHNAFGFGLPAKSDTVARLFDGIPLEGLHLRIDNHPHGRIVTTPFIDYLQQNHIDPLKTKITFGTDPTATLATTGRLKMSIAALKASLPQSMSTFFSSGLPGVVLEADGRPYHNAGATEAQEIGAMLSVALGHLRMVEEARHHIIYALPHIGFATSLDQNPTLGLAKMRALRILWRKLQEECGVSNPLPAIIHVETSMRMMSTLTPLANLSRTAFATYAAISGGATSLSVLPYSCTTGLADSNARREALNCQLIPAEENVAPLARHATRRAADADSLAEAAWAEYKRFEAKGGVMQALIDGSLAAGIEEAKDLRVTSYIKGERTLIGTTRYHGQTIAPSGIYDKQTPLTFEAEGMVHCAPLLLKRLETGFEDAVANAPLGAERGVS